MKATAESGGAATIICAFATGKGSAFGLDFKVRATVELEKKRGVFIKDLNNPREPTTLAEYCVKGALRKYGVKCGANATIESEIPMAAGLKSSSALANAVTLATIGAIARDRGSITEKRIVKGYTKQLIEIEGRRVDLIDAVNIGVDAAFKAKTTVTGAFDDATASMLGGYTITDNKNRILIHRGEIEDLNVVVYVPRKKSYSGDVNIKQVKPFANEIDLAWNQALAGRVYQALTINGLIHSTVFGYDNRIAYNALEAGAIAAGLTGKGPAVVALTRKKTKPIKDAWSGLKGRIIECKTSNLGGRIVD
ncbi:MAG: shikimate kinase [Candidatus Altiarchaeota archaeon]